MKRGVVKVTACCLAGSVIFASTGLTAFAAGEMPLAGIGAEIIASQEKKENSETKKVIATGYDSLVIAQVDEYVQRQVRSLESYITIQQQRSLVRQVTGT